MPRDGNSQTRTTHVKDRSLIVPGSCTKYIHEAPDVVWNKPSKANVTKKYDEWMAGEAHSFTAAGNMRAPARREIVKWILAAWDGLDKTMIINSFKSCALTVAVDGLEDGHIHCFKENQPCRAGLQRLKVFQLAMSNSRDKDPFDGITESDVEDAAPDSLIIDLSDSRTFNVPYMYTCYSYGI